MNKILTILAVPMMMLAFSGHSAMVSGRVLYVLEKVSSGANYTKTFKDQDRTFIGLLEEEYNKACGIISKGGKFGAPACAVVTPKGNEGPLYYIEYNVYRTGTPAEDLVGFIRDTTTKGQGLGGDKATGVFKCDVAHCATAR